MIVKEADAVRSRSRRVQAGAQAEQDMAFYLRRAFADREDVFVFHDLRLVHGGQSAQIDHLVLHRHGMFIIETKSVSGEIHITPTGQFIRHFGKGQKSGMESPVAQAARQRDLLRKLLIANKTELRDRKLLGMIPGGFKYCPIETRVAISPKGIIMGEEHAPQVRKADLIPDEINERVEAHRHGGRLLNLNFSNDDGIYTFSDAELNRVKEFLLKQDRLARQSKGASESATTPPAEETGPGSAQHKPTRRSNAGAKDAGDSARGTGTDSHPAAATAASTSPPRRVQLPKYLCSKCHSLNLRILYGKYGYYFKCDDCAGNTPIDTSIEGADRKGRVRKSGREFYFVCNESGEEQLIFVNPIE